MAGDDGMVAIVQGLRDAGLAVTVLEGGRQYTLIPDTVPHAPSESPEHVSRNAQERSPATAAASKQLPLRSDSSTQAYASIYKMARCNINPTSPPAVRKFPPQRAELRPGQGSIEVGDAGSGETYNPVRPTTHYRGGISLPARGSRSRMSPIRLSEENSKRTPDCETRAVPTWQICYEPKVNLRPRVKTDEAPTREGKSIRRDMSQKINPTEFSRDLESSCLRDVSNRLWDVFPNSSGQITMTKNMNSQAAVETISREVATLPYAEPYTRNVPVSPITSKSHGHLFDTGPRGSSFKYVQTTLMDDLPKNRMQATSSAMELLTEDKGQCFKSRGRKNKSQEELRTRKNNLKKEILKLLQSIDCHDDEVYQSFRCELTRQIKNNKKNILINSSRSKNGPFWFKASCRYCVDNSRRVKTFNVYRAETQSIGVPNDNSLQTTVKDWVQEIVTKNSVLNLDELANPLTEKLRHLCLKSDDIRKSELKQMIDEVIFDANDNILNVRLHSSADEPAGKIKDVLHSSAKKLKRCKPRIGNNNLKCFSFQEINQPTVEEMRNFVREELLVFMNKFNLNFNSCNIADVETEVINILIGCIDELESGNKDKVKKEVAILLRDTSKMPEYYFACLADALVKRFKSFIHAFNIHNINRLHKQTFLVLQNTVHNTLEQTMSGSDADAQIERYTSQLTQVIEAWWTSIFGADENEKGFREVAINDLAGDIVDRHRFLGMDTSKLSSDEDEVEYLKYQIFRWINKLVGDEALQQALSRAPELMNQIQQIPVPVMRLSEELPRLPNVIERPRSPAPVKSTSPGKADPTKPNYNVNHLPSFNPVGRGGGLSDNSKIRRAINRRMSEPRAYVSFDLPKPGCCNRSPQSRRYSLPDNPRQNLKDTIPSMPQLIRDFDIYLREWVIQIPVPENNPQEQDAARRLRKDIYDGLLSAFVLAISNPTKFRNEFYLQDFFDKEIDKLLSCVPDSQRLTSQNQFLKMELAKRIADTIIAIKKANTSTSYKYKLWDVVTNRLPPRPAMEDRDKTAAHLFEELLKLNLAEDYLLYRRYLDINKSKQEAYRQKVFISIQKLYDNAKLLPDGDHLPSSEDFSGIILTGFGGVVIPSVDALQDEANQIVLGHEISQWMQDLSIAPSDALLDQLQKRRLRDSLAKKIHDIEKQTNMCENSAVRLMKNELSKFLEKFPLRPEAAGNLSFLIDEFINRLKNRRENVKKTLNFHKFFKDVPFSSSHVERSNLIVNVDTIEDWENLEPSAAASRMLGAELVPAMNKEPTDVQWLTLLNTQEQLQRERQAQELAAQAEQIPPCCRPAAVQRLGPPSVGSNIGSNQQLPHRAPSNLERLLNTQEWMKREKAALVQSQQIPSCCQPVIATTQRHYTSMPPGAVYEPAVRTDARTLHTSQVAGTSFHPVAYPGRQIGVPAAAPSTEMRRFTDLQDQPPFMMPGAPADRPGPSGVTSFGQPPAVNGILRTTQMPGPSGMSRPRQFGSPQQIMSSRGGLSNQSQHLAAPLAQQEAPVTVRHNLEDIPEQNISRPFMSPLDLSIQAPVGFSTPRQSLEGRARAPEIGDAENIPGEPRARRNRAREGEAMRPEAGRRRLDLEEVEEEEEREQDEVQCRCTERVYRRRRRRPACCDCEDMDYPRYYPMPNPYCFL